MERPFQWACDGAPHDARESPHAIGYRRHANGFARLGVRAAQRSKSVGCLGNGYGLIINHVGITELKSRIQRSQPRTDPQRVYEFYQTFSFLGGPRQLNGPAMQISRRLKRLHGKRETSRSGKRFEHRP